MEPSSMVLVALAVVMVVVVLWLRNRKEASSAESDFDRRVKAMQASLSASGPVQPTQTVKAEREALFWKIADLVRPKTPSPPRETITRDDPVLGRLDFWEGDEGEWERVGLPELGLESAVLTVFAGREGPSDAQRACYSALVADHEAIFARAIAVAEREVRAQRAGLRAEEEDASDNEMELDAVYVQRAKPGTSEVGGALHFSTGASDEGVHLETSDGWRSFRVNRD